MHEWRWLWLVDMPSFGRSVWLVLYGVNAAAHAAQVADPSLCAASHQRGFKRRAPACAKRHASAPRSQTRDPLYEARKLPIMTRERTQQHG
ncbi:MAG: hypothetical protein OXI96_03035 [Acidimicrobiaceae bacterium]|nr:hypothetical protein [Acidimicrobiaceae bacterium]